MPSNAIKYHDRLFKINYLKKYEKIHRAVTVPITIEIPFDLTPRDFIKFAKADFKLKKKRGVVNALSNIKRALHCQLDCLIHTCGFEIVAKKERWNIDNKVSFLQELEIITPDFLKKINRQRNLLEHEYMMASREKVEDAIDFIELFVIHTEKYIHNTIDECQFGYYFRDKCYESPIIRFDRDNLKFIICEDITKNGELKFNPLLEVNKKSKEFYILLRAFLHT